jgi:hypothetical protein
MVSKKCPLISLSRLHFIQILYYKIYAYTYICIHACTRAYHAYIRQILQILRSMYFNVILDAQKFFDINEIDRDLQRYFMYIHIKSTTKSRIMGSHDREALKRYGCRCCWSVCTVAMIFSGRSITAMSNVTSRSGAAISSANHRDRAQVLPCSVDSARISSYPLPLSLLPEHLLNLRHVHHHVARVIEVISMMTSLFLV